MDDDLRADAASALRRLGHAFISHDIDDDVMRRVSRESNALADALERTPPRERDLLKLKQSMFGENADQGGRISHFEECFVSGLHNPMGIAIDVTRDGDVAVANVALGAAFEGAPGRSHGGIVAAIFDDVMGYLLSFLRTPAFTGEMTVRYRKATPIGAPLEYRAWLHDREGRRLLTRATAHAGDDLVAEAEATFITVPLDRFRR